MRFAKSTLGLCCALALGAAPAFAAEPTLPAPTAPVPRAGADPVTGDWVTIGGTVRSVSGQHFILDTGTSRIPVDMDGYASLDVRPGERVTVTGRMLNPLTDHPLLNASSVAIPSRNQRFWSNPSDDGGGYYAYAPQGTAAAPLTLTGTVVDAHAPDAFTIATGNGTYAVDGSDVPGLRTRPILIGDRVSVSGRLAGLFDRRQIDATSVTVIAPNRAL